MQDFVKAFFFFFFYIWLPLKILAHNFIPSLKVKDLLELSSH